MAANSRSRSSVTSPAPPPRRLASNMSAGVLVAVAAVAVAGGFAVYKKVTAPPAPGQPPFASFGLRSLKLARTKVVNHDVKRLRFELGDPKLQSGLTLTSALLAISFPNGGWMPVFRPYTPINDLDDTGYIDFMVKKYPNGKQSTHLHNLSPGDSLTFLRIPGYSWKPNQAEHVALIAGGQGITPCFQLLKGILKNKADQTRVTLVWGVNTDDDIVLSQELSMLERQNPGRFKTIYAVSKPGPASRHARGHVTKELLENAGVKPGEGGVGKVFLCGPPPMEKVMVGKTGVLSSIGFTPAQVHKF